MKPPAVDSQPLPLSLQFLTPNTSLPMNDPIDTPIRGEILSTLESLIEINRDGQEGFRLAAENAQATELKSVFSQYGSERGVMIGELQTLQRQHGQTDVDDGGTVVGGLHRAWINLRSVIASKNDQAILEEAERGEDAALDAYRDALKPATPPFPRSITSVLEPHLSKVQAAHDDVRDRRDSGRYDVKDT